MMIEWIFWRLNAKFLSFHCFHLQNGHDDDDNLISFKRIQLLFEIIDYDFEMIHDILFHIISIDY